MRFKTMRLTAIHNGPKRTLSASGGLELGLGLLHNLNYELIVLVVNLNSKLTSHTLSITNISMELFRFRLIMHSFRGLGLFLPNFLIIFSFLYQKHLNS